MDATRPTKATPIEFDRQAGTATVFEQIIRSCLRHAAANAPLIRLDTPEACHQTRVGLRRTRSALWLFRAQLDRKKARKLSHTVRDVSQSLSSLRDWDVFVDETIPKIAKRDKGDWIARLGQAAEHKRQMLYEGFTLELPEPHVCELVATDDPFVPIATTAPDMLDRAYFAVRHDCRRVATPELRHDLRKTMKKLRYGIEFFGHLYETSDAKAVKNFLDACKEMQDVLGEINDAQTMLHLMRELGEVPDDWLHATESREHKAVDHLAKHITEFQMTRPFWD
jgi:triphosphatase